jgi:hypothetical protein
MSPTSGLRTSATETIVASVGLICPASILATYCCVDPAISARVDWVGPAIRWDARRIFLKRACRWSSPALLTPDAVSPWPVMIGARLRRPPVDRHHTRCLGKSAEGWQARIAASAFDLCGRRPAWATRVLMLDLGL